MDKRYQVFVSSTYADLQMERSKVIQTIMELDCIPAGMEIFPAIDEEQFEFIKRIIDDCDYYILIIGGRYGTISNDGLSYTELEYNYAIKRGIKVMAFIHSNPNEIPLGKSEMDKTLREKLDAFKLKVSTGRLIKYWTSAEELPGLVALSLSKTIKTYPAIGWVRADLTAGPEVFKEMNAIIIENTELKNLLKQQTINLEIQEKEIAGLDDKYNITGIVNTGKYGNQIWEVNITWGEIFALISPYLLESQSDSSMNYIVKKALYEVSEYKHTFSTTSVVINDQDFQTIKIHLKSLGLINLENIKTTNGSVALYWTLSEIGQKILLQLRTVKK